MNETAHRPYRAPVTGVRQTYTDVTADQLAVDDDRSHVVTTVAATVVINIVINFALKHDRTVREI